jgi:predicted unusual protein kinase regulating ubiquinone biosynthesis (AarF/ABC1/UbiB family)
MTKNGYIGLLQFSFHKDSSFSIQVHSAKLKSSGQEVVIKVLKPGIEDVLVADLNFIYVVSRILEFLNPELRRTSLVSKLFIPF